MCPYINAHVHSGPNLCIYILSLNCAHPQRILIPKFSDRVKGGNCSLRAEASPHEIADLSGVWIYFLYLKCTRNFRDEKCFSQNAFEVQKCFWAPEPLKTLFIPENRYQHFREPKVFLPRGRKTLSVPEFFRLKTLIRAPEPFTPKHP